MTRSSMRLRPAKSTWPGMVPLSYVHIKQRPERSLFASWRCGIVDVNFRTQLFTRRDSRHRHLGRPEGEARGSWGVAAGPSGTAALYFLKQHASIRSEIWPPVPFWPRSASRVPLSEERRSSNSCSQGHMMRVRESTDPDGLNRARPADLQDTLRVFLVEPRVQPLLLYAHREWMRNSPENHRRVPLAALHRPAGQRGAGRRGLARRLCQHHDRLGRR